MTDGDDIHLAQTDRECERCSDPAANYCGKCGNDLCIVCMIEGCCGLVPAMSGNHGPMVDEV